MGLLPVIMSPYIDFFFTSRVLQIAFQGNFCLCMKISFHLKIVFTVGGAQLVFIYLPEAIAKLPVAPIYSILYFIMVISIILTTAVSFISE